MTVVVRDAEPRDLPAIVDIYNEVIDTSDAIWLDEHVTHADRLAWYDEQVAAGFPVLVAVADGDDDHVVGYGSFGPFRAKAGYWPTVEHTIHVHRDHRGRGVGQALLDDLLRRAAADGRRVVVAGVDGGNEGSIRFHERNGFREVARMPGIGRKWGRPVDLVLLQLDLPDPAPSGGPS
ncbi:MAG: N-acetyltransferase family protein [Acidimicrobiales bacterium]|nr:N-acetyltransferase [Actinomycetota bacterium]